MSIETRNHEGRLELTQHGEDRGRWRRAIVVAVGLLLCFAPLALLPASGAGAFAALIGIEILLLGTAVCLLAEGSRQTHARVSLHVATGEVEIRAGRGLLSRRRAFGPVEAERVLLVKGNRAGRPVYGVLVLPRDGKPVPVFLGEEDEPAARDAALVLAQGMNVSVDDRRYPQPGDGSISCSRFPERVVRTESGSDKTFTWNYRERFRWRLVLLGLGTAASVVSALLLLHAGRPGVDLGGGVVLVGIGITVLGHSATTLGGRSVTLRPDAVEIERRLAGMRFARRCIPFAELKAVLVVPRGTLATVLFRSEHSRFGGALRAEDRRVAGWLQNLVQRSAHFAGRKTTPLAG